jgi:hypothetical protein
MLKHLSFDGDRTTYLIQGQEFVLNFHFTKCLFILVYYNNGKYPDTRFHFNKFLNKISFMSPKGTFKSTTNVYHPEIKFITFGFGIKIHHFPLKVNFLNTIQPSLTIKESNFKKAPVVKINENRVVLNPIKFNKKQHDPTLNVLEMELNNKSELSYTNFKLLNYESN